MTTVIDLLIIYTDHTRKTIIHVEDYGCKEDIFWFKKNGYTSFLPKENIVYFWKRIRL